MCGIGGILRISPGGHSAAARPPGASIEERWLDALDDAIRHRGPDGQGRFRDRAIDHSGRIVDIALVHRRLSIIDHACGAQPMVSAAGPGLVATVFNGCIYNHRLLRAELASAGHRFSTDHSDTEVLLHGARQWGGSLQAHLDGMYAAVIWDRTRASLTLLRDAAGEKPLWFSVFDAGAERFAVFASNARAVIQTRRAIDHAWSPRVDPATMRPWLVFGFAAHAPVRGVFSLPPGTTLDVSNAAPDAAPPRDRTVPLPARSAAPRLTVESLDVLIDAAVASRLEADVPLACFLSGGIDSSLVAHYARRHRPNIEAFTVRMPDPGLDESTYARNAATHLGITHRVLDCDTRPAADLERLISITGLPLGDSSLLPTHWVSQAAARHARVALGGDGGDELFAGYDRHRAAVWLARYRRMLALLPGADSAVAAAPRSRRSRLGRLADAARGGGYPDLLAVFPPRMAAGLLRDAPGTHRAATTTDAPRHDFETYLPEDLLLKVDSASMACPIEVRAPLLSRSMIAAALAEPLASLTSGGRKGLLRAVARKHLPAALVDRPKQGFAIPIGRWFRTDFGGLGSLLQDRLGSREPFGPESLGVPIDPTAARRLVADHLENRADHGQRLFILLAISLWASSISRA